MPPVRVGVWGVGTWGEKHARVYRTLMQSGEGVELVGVSDRDSARVRQVAERHGCRAFEDVVDLLEEVDAVSIALPTVAHRAAAETALGAGCHVLVEKPMAASVREADAMLAAAQKAGRALQVGHVERFSPALTAARTVVRNPKFVEAHRLAAFQPRSLDVDVVFDLMIHDIDIVLETVGAVPASVAAVGVSVLSGSEDIANARLEFPDGCVANLTASRVSQERLRRIRFFQGDAYVSVDLFDRVVDVLRFQAQSLGSLAESAATVAAGGPALVRGRLEVGDGEPLLLELRAFTRSLRGDGAGAAGGWSGREAMRVAEEVRSEMKRRTLQWTAR